MFSDIYFINYCDSYIQDSHSSAPVYHTFVLKKMPALQLKYMLTINLPLFKKLWDIFFFFAGQSLYEPFQGTFWGGQDFFDPLNCPELSKGQFRGQKSRGPLKMSREMAHKVIVPKKNKIMSQSFLNSDTLVILCLFATMGPELCPAVS